MDLRDDETKPQQVIEEGTTVLSGGHFKLEKRRLQVETFAGKMSRTLVREVLRSGRVVAVLLYDPVAEKLLMIQQFRIGAMLNGIENPWIYEVVAGMVDGDETAEVAAHREVMEETGCTVSPLEPIGRYLTSPGITDEFVSLFVGRVESGKAGGVHGQVSEAEDVRTILMSTEEALAAAGSGMFLNAITQIALLWFGLHGAELRRRWLAGVAPE